MRRKKMLTGYLKSKISTKMVKVKRRMMMMKMLSMKQFTIK
jgi:hypothetical protein